MDRRQRRDALTSADIPQSILEGAPEVGRLFEDCKPVERDYYRYTGICPIMHTVVVKRELYEKNRAIVKAVYAGFRSAKDGQLERPGASGWTHGAIKGSGVQVLQRR